MAEVRGHYSQGRLSGQAKVGCDGENIILSNKNIEVVFRDRTFLLGYFKRGSLHGFVRHFDSGGRLAELGCTRRGARQADCGMATQQHQSQRWGWL